MEKIITFFVCLFILLCHYPLMAQTQPVVEINEQWKTKIRELAPAKPTATPKKKHKVLLFSVFTGFEHWCVPHTDLVVKILGEKSGAYEVVQSRDLAQFSKKNIKQYDAVILNNTCSKPTHRNLFFDMIELNTNLSEVQKINKAAEYESNLINYVANGGGLVILHGAVTILNKSSLFGMTMGGNFDYHPVQQPINVQLAEPQHPLLQAFKGQAFTHIDEPYFFNNSYNEYHFHPLLWMDASQLHSLREPVKENKRYIAWIKKFGNGRIFYSSPSHNAQSFEKPELLQFFLDGIQYTVGDIACDDSPMK
jgi:uncharacterized protein